MIFDVTLLMTSAQLGNATEAFAVPAGGSILTPVSVAATAAVPADQAAWSALLDGSWEGSVGQGLTAVPQKRVAIDQIPKLSGVDLLAGLGGLTPSDLDRVIDQNPKLVDSLLRHPPAAADTAAMWRIASPAGRRALADRVPRLVGNLEGIPYAARDAANRADVSTQIRDIQKRLDRGIGRAASGDLQAKLHMLQQVQLALKSTDGIPRELVQLDTRGEGTAVISVGDLATADYVSYLIPGMFYGVDARIVPWTGIAADLAADQGNWLDRLDRGDEHAAVLSWIGYRTPTLVDVASMTDAREGSVALSASLRGLAATRSQTPYVSVLAHSYGATAALLALSSEHSGSPVQVNALAMVGSPGSPAQNVGDLKVANGNVWVGAARWDPISLSGVFGSQPTASGYGAQAMGVDGGVDPLTSSRLAGTVSHNDYFSAGSETLRNFALIGIDAGGYVLQSGGRMLAAG